MKSKCGACLHNVNMDRQRPVGFVLHQCDDVSWTVVEGYHIYVRWTRHRGVAAHAFDWGDFTTPEEPHDGT